MNIREQQQKNENDFNTYKNVKIEKLHSLRNKRLISSKTFNRIQIYQKMSKSRVNKPFKSVMKQNIKQIYKRELTRKEFIQYFGNDYKTKNTQETQKETINNTKNLLIQHKGSDIKA